jgi:predicted Fe-S protein YdhL (DUF1289 family)
MAPFGGEIPNAGALDQSAEGRACTGCGQVRAEAREVDARPHTQTSGVLQRIPRRLDQIRIQGNNARRLCETLDKPAGPARRGRDCDSGNVRYHSRVRVRLSARLSKDERRRRRGTGAIGLLRRGQASDPALPLLVAGKLHGRGFERRRLRAPLSHYHARPEHRKAHEHRALRNLGDRHGPASPTPRPSSQQRSRAKTSFRLSHRPEASMALSRGVK